MCCQHPQVWGSMRLAEEDSAAVTNDGCSERSSEAISCKWHSALIYVNEFINSTSTSPLETGEAITDATGGICMSRSMGVIAEVTARQSHWEAEDACSLCKRNWALGGIRSPVPTSVLCCLSCKAGTWEQKSNFENKSHLEDKEAAF